MKNIWAVGRNYRAHALELGNEVPKEPLIFLKSGSCKVQAPEVQLPAWAQEIHYEGELALEFTQDANKNWSFRQIFLALDLTERKKQAELKAKGSPWTLAKSFTNSCPLSLRSIPFRAWDHFLRLQFTLKVNGEQKQKGYPKDMIFDLEVLKNYVLQHFPVESGDLLLTGTPEGVGALRPGDTIEMELFHEDDLTRPSLQQKWSFLS